MQPIDKELSRYGIDLSKPSEQKRVLEFIDREQPDLILLAPPCGDYSPLQNIMPKCPMKRWRKTQRLLWETSSKCPPLEVHSKNNERVYPWSFEGSVGWS